MTTWGWKLGSPEATVSSSSAGVTPAQTQLNGGQVGAVNSPATHTTAPQTVAGGPGPGTGTMQTQGTGNPGNQYGNSPQQGDRWQGGAANPNGTQAPNGRQTGGRYVDPTYGTDATGRQLTPAEQAGWKQYDANRATAATQEQAGYQAYKANQANANPSANGLDYDPDTKSWQYYDTKAKKWTPGGSLSDIYNNVFNDQQRAAHPQFFYENQADDADYSALRHDQYMYQTEQGYALQGTPTTRYTPTSY